MILSLWPVGHMWPTEPCDLAQDLKPRKHMPVLWDGKSASPDHSVYGCDSYDFLVLHFLLSTIEVTIDASNQGVLEVKEMV